MALLREKHGSHHARAAGEVAAVPALHVDAAIWDPDEAFSSMGVREVQDMEATLRASHGMLTTKLRALVSERYRDMLGTANTLIDLSASSSRLVERLHAVVAGIESADAQSIEGGIAAGSKATEQKEATTTQQATQQGDAISDVSALVAVTRFLVEAPDEVRRSTEEARLLQEGKWRSAASPSTRNDCAPRRRYRQERELVAAHIFRAAYLCVMAQNAWNWLTGEDGPLAVDAKFRGNKVAALFPYVAQSYNALQAMRASVIIRGRDGLQGWTKAELDSPLLWRDFAMSSKATATILLSLALLQEGNMNSLFHAFLQVRARVLEDRVRDASQAKDPGQHMSFALYFVADTLSQGFRAFCSSRNTLPQTQQASLRIAEGLSILHTQQASAEARSTSFPPRASDVVQTMPSADLLLKGLPECILVSQSAATNELDESAVVTALCKWSRAVHEGALTAYLGTVSSALRSIEDVSKAQNTLCRCLGRLRNSYIMLQNPDRDVELLRRQIKETAKRVNDTMAERLYAICSERGEELCKSIDLEMSGAMRDLQKQNATAPGAEAHSFATDEIASRKDYYYDEVRDTHKLSPTSGAQNVASLIDKGTIALLQEMRQYLGNFQVLVAKSNVSENEGTRPRHDFIFAGIADAEAQQVVRDSFETCVQNVRQKIVRNLTSIAEKALPRDSTQEMADSVDEIAFAPILFLAQTTSMLQYSFPFRGENSLPLRALEHRLLKAWADAVVGKCMAEYVLLSKTDQGELSRPTNGELVSPSRALLQALHRLAQGYHVTKCRQRSHSIWLRQQLAEGFACKWLAFVRTEKATSVELSHNLFIDSQVLHAILAGDGSERSRHTGQVESDLVEFAAKVCKASDVTLERLQEAAALAISRVRLLIVSLATDEVRFLQRTSIGSSMPYRIDPATRSARPDGTPPSLKEGQAASTGQSDIPSFRPLPPLQPALSVAQS